MFPGGCPTQAGGDTRDMILSLTATVINGTAYITLVPWDYYRERYWTLMVNGRWIGRNFYVDAFQPSVEVAIPLDPGTTIGSIYPVDCGNWDSFNPDCIPSEEAELDDAITARRLLIKWTAAYQTSTIDGDSQITQLSITGARRGRNVLVDPDMPQRGTLTYSILTAGSNVIVRWYSGDQLVAEGFGSRYSDDLDTSGSNLIANGSAFNSASWTNVNTTETADSTIDADGGATADTLTETVANGYHQIYQTVTGLTSGRRYRVTVRVKDNGVRYISLGIHLLGASGSYTFDLQNGENYTLSNTAGIEALSGGWYKLTYSFVATSTQHDITIGLNRGPSDSYAGDGASGAYLYKAEMYLLEQFECDEVNDSGLSATFDLTNFPNALKPGVATVALHWPKSYQIHYSTSALAYPRTAEATVYDRGSDEFIHHTGILAAGSYDYNVLQVDDEGNAQTSVSAPSDSPLVINTAPAAPTITSVSKTGADFIINFTNGEAGCQYIGYVSPINEPINYGSRSSPGPSALSAVDATTINMGALTGTAVSDFTSAFSTLKTSFDSAVTAANTVFDAGESGFLTGLATLETALLAAIAVWETAIDRPLLDAREALSRQVELVESAEALVADDAMATADWQTYMGSYYAGLLDYVGALLEGRSGRYTLPGGQIGGGAAAGGDDPGGAAPDGSTASTGFTLSNSLYAAGVSVVKPGYLRFVVRATKGGIEETNDVEYLVEVNGSNAIEEKRPNPADVQQISFASGSISVKAGVNEENARVAATIIDIYVVARGAAITLSSPTASGNLATVNGGYHEVTVSYAMPGNGWFDIAVLSRTAAGQRQEQYTRIPKYYSSAVPGAVTSISGKVLRGSPIRPEES